MKHNYKRFLAMVMAVVMIVGMMPMNVFAADGDTKTVYFRNNWQWTDVRMYAWDANDTNVTAAWPGDSMTKVEDDGTYDIYSAEVPANAVGIIFSGIKNDGSGARDQSPNVTAFADGSAYEMLWIDGTGNTVKEIEYTYICPHTDTTTTTVEATCTEAGSATTTCDSCGETTETIEIAALGHNYVDGVCTVCTDADPDYVAPITGTITEDTVWADGTVVGDVTISGDVTITVNGTVTVAGTIAMYTDSIHTVTIQGGTDDAKLIRGNDFTGQMFYVEGTSYVFQNLNIKDLILDGGAVWTGETDAILNRGTVNEGIKATGSVLYLVRANAVLDNCTLQNHDDGTGEKANAVFLREYASIAFNDSVVKNNNSPSGYWKGGVVTTRYGGIVTANNSEIYGNSASHGGFVGVSSSGSYGTKVDCVNTKLHHNYASVGGAVFYLQDNGSRFFQTLGDNRYSYVKLDGCTLENNGSPNGLFYNWVYFMPAWIKDTTIANNDCAIYTFHQDNRSFSVAGKTNITSDREDCLYQNPVRIYGALDTAASIPMTEATVTKLMDGYGYLATATPDIPHAYNHTGDGRYVVTYEYTSRALYDITLADLAQVKLYEGSGYTGWILTDVDGNGMMDAVPVNVADTTVNVTLTDTFKGAGDTQTQDVSTVVENVPVCYYEHSGYFFNGWLMEDGTLIKDVNSNVILSGGENLTAAWAVARPRFSISATATKAAVGESVKLTLDVTNMNTEYLDYTYQWYKDGTAIEGATDSTYTVTEADAGFYSYQCTITATDDTYNSDTDYASKTTYGTAKRKENIVLQFTDTPAEPVYVAEINGVQYESIQAAVNAAVEGDTITVLVDHAVSETVIVDKNVNIDLNGKTVTVAETLNATPAFRILADVTVEGDGVVDATAGTSSYAFIVGNSTTEGTLTVKDGRYFGDTTVASVTQGTLNIEGGYFEATPYTDESGVEYGYRYTLNCIDANYTADTANINVTGGTFYGFDPSNNLAEGAETDFVPEGYGTTNDAEANTWTVSRVYNYVAKIEETGEQFETLADAVAAANAMEKATITMLADITLGEKLTVTGDVTIQGEYTLTRDAAYTGTFFDVPAEATLTLDGGLTIDGGNKWILDEEGYEAALWANDTDYAGFAFVTSAEGAPVAKADMFNVNGALVMNEVTVQNHMGNNNCGVVQLAGSLTLNDGATIQHNATSHAAIVANMTAGSTFTINEGALITDNYYAKNGGIAINAGGLIVMNGGEVSNNNGVNTNGTFAMMYTGNAKFVMNGGTICSNTSVCGSGAGRCSPIYLHSTGIMEMNGGYICHNTGAGYGGIDAPYESTSLTIKGGYVIHNTSIVGRNTYDVNAGVGETTITGGTYTQDVAQWVPEGYGVAIEVVEENGEEVIYYTVTDQIIRLERTGEIYCSIREAMKVAEDGDTLTVLCSHRIDNETVILDKDVTIDLGGKTIYGWGTLNPVFRVQADVTVTGEGKMDTRKYADAYAFILGASDGSVSGNLTIAGGTYLSDITVASVTKGNLNITGGQFAVTAWQQVVGTDDAGNDITEDNYNFLLNCVDANYKDGSASVSVTGGTFYMFDPENNEAEGVGTNFVPNTHYSNEDKENYWTVYAKNVITVTFDDKTMVHGNEMPAFTYTTNFTEVAEDGTMLVVGEPEVTVDGAGEYEITAEAYVFMNDTYLVNVVPGKLTVAAAVAEVEETGVKYASLQEAMNACADGGNVRVIADIEVDGSDIVSVPASTNSNGKYFNPGIFNLVGDVAVTVDLNGHNITYHGHAVAPYTATYNKDKYYNEETGEYEVNSCTIAHGLFFANAGANLTIVDSTGEATVDVYGLASAAYSASPNSVITIEGGTWTNEGCETCGGTNLFLYASHGGELYIKGGWFEQALDGDGNSYLIVEQSGTLKNEVIDYSLTKVEVSGGYFVGMDPEQAVYIYDNSFSTTNVVAEGLISVEVQENVWTVMTPVEAGYVAYNVQDDLYFTDLSDALDVADAGETVQLLTYTEESIVMVSANVTFDLNGNVVKTDNVLSFGAVIDAQKEVGGIQIDIDTTKAFTKLQPENAGYLPIYDTATGTYKFFAYELQGRGYMSGTNSVTFGVSIGFENAEAYNVLATTGNSGVELALDLDWTGMNVTNVSYVIPDATVKTYAAMAYGQALEDTATALVTLKVHGLEKLDSGSFVSAMPTISTITEVGSTDAVMVYNLP